MAVVELKHHNSTKATLLRHQTVAEQSQFIRPQGVNTAVSSRLKNCMFATFTRLLKAASKRKLVAAAQHHVHRDKADNLLMLVQ
jgi:hypothetical protein